jgi:REP element-mobilizing transposase RayT
MSRVPRSGVLVPGGTYHVTTRGNNRGPIYLQDDDRHLFLNFFRKVARRLRWVCHEWCLMTTHYHLLIATPDPDLPLGMHWLNGVYAQTFNDRYSRTGHLFEKRYSARLVDSEEYFAAALDYIRWNPVVAGLCEHPAEWPWRGPSRLERPLSQGVRTL